MFFYFYFYNLYNKMVKKSYYKNCFYSIFLLFFFFLYLIFFYKNFYIDNLSFLFIFLTIFVILSCLFYIIVTSFFSKKYFLFLISSLGVLIILCFFVSNFFLFYIIFEFLLVIMVCILCFWGYRGRKIHATFLLFFYTVLGSPFIFLGMVIFYFYSGVIFFDSFWLFFVNSYEKNVFLLIFVLFFFGFASKIPIFPLHIWLPEAHVEAPTVGSVILASLLLKLGFYGMYRVLIQGFIINFLWFLPFMYTLFSLSILYCGLSACRQIDIKKLIAYSSIVHMNIGLFGAFSMGINGLIGCIFLMISHGFISGGLFFFSGFLYNRYHTRNLLYYGGLSQFMPIGSLLFLLFIISSVNFPGTFGFVGEFLVIYNIFFLTSAINTIVLIFGLFFCMIFSFILYNKIFFGQISGFLYNKTDLSLYEFFILILFLFWNFYFGFTPIVGFEETIKIILI